MTGTSETGQRTPAAVDHTYAAGGTYDVTLTVTDDTGATGQKVLRQTVTQAPVANVQVSCLDLTCDLDASASSGGSGVLTDYAWNFGDGSTGDSAAHLRRGRDYTLSLTVTNDLGETAQLPVTRSRSARRPAWEHGRRSTMSPPAACEQSCGNGPRKPATRGNRHGGTRSGHQGRHHAPGVRRHERERSGRGTRRRRGNDAAGRPHGADG